MRLASEGDISRALGILRPLAEVSDDPERVSAKLRTISLK
jgi:hypothetical protein